jgi:hypothetical protein
MHCRLTRRNTAGETPGGKKIATLRNGRIITITATAPDGRGEIFARTAIKLRGRNTAGWVYLKHLQCGSTPPAAAPPPAAAAPAASQEQIVFLADQRRLSDASYANFYVQPARVNGVQYSRTVSLDPSQDQASFVEYDLGRKAKRLVGTVGVRDDSQSDVSMRLEIYVDGRKIFDQTMGLGQAVPVDLDVANTLRLRLQVTELTVNRKVENFMVFGDMRYTTTG